MSDQLPGLCASCGLPGHRYGRNEGPKRYDPMACINSLRSEVERLQADLADAIRHLRAHDPTCIVLIENIQFGTEPADGSEAPQYDEPGASA